MVYGTQCERKSRLGHPKRELSVKRRGGGAHGPKGLSLRGRVGWGTWSSGNQCELGTRMAYQAESFGVSCPTYSPSHTELPGRMHQPALPLTLSPIDHVPSPLFLSHCFP